MECQKTEDNKPLRASSSSSSQSLPLSSLDPSSSSVKPVKALYKKDS